MAALFRTLFRAIVTLSLDSVSALLRSTPSSQPRAKEKVRQFAAYTTIYPFTELEEDFMFAEILPKLPVKSLMRFKCVSKSWSDCISRDLSFMEAHLKQQRNNSHGIILGRYQTSSQISDDRQRMTLHSDRGLKMKEVDVAHIVARHGFIEIVGSCNGLICLLSVLPGVSQTPKSLLLWNPATRQLRKLPKALINNTRSFGFGFDSASEDYKIVYLATKGFKDKPFLSAQVFTKSGTIWRRTKGNLGVRGRPVMLPSRGAIEANGALHWVARMSKNENTFVVSFGLSDELLRSAQGPGGNSWCLCNWRDSLAAVAPSKEGGGYDMWEATWSTGRDLRWRQLYKICHLTRCFLGVLSGQFLSAQHTFSSFGVGMLLYRNDPKVDDTHWTIAQGPIYWQVSYSNNYFESIISVV